MFSYFCGPDQGRWVVRDYRTPESALETFLEAVRREHTQTIAEALSEDAKRAYGLTGIFETTLAWERLKTEVPGLHLLGEAAVPPLQPSGDGRWRATLTVAGQVIDLWLVEQPFWDVLGWAVHTLAASPCWISPQSPHRRMTSFTTDWSRLET